MFGGLVVWWLYGRPLPGALCEPSPEDELRWPVIAKALAVQRQEFARVWGPRIAEERRRMVQ